MLREVLAVPGRYLVACERIDLIEEHSRFLQQEAQRASIGLPDLRHIHGQQRRAGNVARQMGDAATELSTSQHAVVFITHEGLRLGDLGNFAGWHARIDEQPQSVASDSFKAGAAHAYLKQMYDLERLIEGEWWLVRAG
jgi:hypothetical protein